MVFSRNVHRFKAMSAKQDAAKDEYRKSIDAALAKTDVFADVGDQIRNASVEALAELSDLNIRGRKELILKAKKMVRFYTRSIQAVPTEKGTMLSAMDLRGYRDEDDDNGENDDDGGGQV